MQVLARRRVTAGIGAVTLTLGSGRLLAQGASGTDQGLLARLREAKRVRAGIADQLPFSTVNPDGTVSGVVPTLAETVMKRLGVPAFDVSIATYGELIPGMLAGRWDFVAAALTVTKARCEQIVFSDPVTLDARAIVSLKRELKDPPTRIAEFVTKNAVVGVMAGGADFRLMLTVGVPQANLRQFPNEAAMMDGLIAKRAQVVFDSHAALAKIIQQRGLDLAITYPIEDDQPTFTACGFRKQDTDLYNAFQSELAALKSSGEFRSIVEQYGFEAPPTLLQATAAQACASQQ